MKEIGKLINVIGYSYLLGIFTLPILAEENKVFTTAVNLYPVGALFGTYGGNFEILLAQTHGFVIEGAAVNRSAQQDLQNASAYGWNVGFQYRWHLTRSMESVFVGVFANYSSYRGQIMDKIGLTTPLVYDYTTQIGLVGLHLGKRWVWDNGINFVARIGFGYSVARRSEAQHPPSDREQSFLNVVFGGISTFFIQSMDAELSVGYAF